MWEEARVCGVCGGSAAGPAGEMGGHRYVRCRGCRVVRLYDRVAPAQVHRMYSGYYPEQDPTPEALRAQLDNPTFAHRRARLEQVVPPGRRRIFEVGCGDGNLLAYLRGHGWEVHGSELDAGTAAVVRRRHGIIPFVGDVAEHAPPGGPFPVVAAYHVLEHVYQPAAWLRAVRALLDEEGILHLQVPNFASWTRRLSGVAWASLMFPQHVYQYTPGTLQALLRACGFQPLHTTTWDPWHGPGTVATSVVNVVRRARGNGLPWPAELADPAPPAARTEAPRPPRAARRLLDALAWPLARAEAGTGHGAVVDVIARVARG